MTIRVRALTDVTSKADVIEFGGRHYGLVTGGRGFETQYFYDTSTGLTHTAADIASPATILRQDGGDPLGFSIDSALVARGIWVDMMGAMNQADGGEGANVLYWPVVVASGPTGTKSGRPSSVLLNGGDVNIVNVAGRWFFSLESGESAVVSFRWATEFGSAGPQVAPTDAARPTQWQVSAIVFVAT